jgi:hypothetical protein
MAKDKLVPLFGLLDDCLGFSLKDLVLKTPEDKAEFKKRLEALTEQFLKEEAEEEKKKR